MIFFLLSRQIQHQFGRAINTGVIIQKGKAEARGKAAKTEKKANPAATKVKASKAPAFKASKAFKDQLN